MKLSKTTINELKNILKKDYGITLDNKELELTANSLIGYYETLFKINLRQEFGNHQPRLIDSTKQKVLDGKKV